MPKTKQQKQKHLHLLPTVGGGASARAQRALLDRWAQVGNENPRPPGPTQRGVPEVAPSQRRVTTHLFQPLHAAKQANLVAAARLWQQPAASLICPPTGGLLSPGSDPSWCRAVAAHTHHRGQALAAAEYRAGQRRKSCQRRSTAGRGDQGADKMSWEFLMWLFAFVLQAGMLGRTMYTVGP